MSMKPSERRKAYGLKRIVVSEHNYMQLKRLGQAGDSFNDVITNLLRIQRNYQKDKERKQQQRLRQQQQESGDHDNNSISNVIDELYSPSVIDEVMEQHRQRMAEIIRMVEEKQ